jgi:hypothetical protein
MTDQPKTLLQRLHAVMGEVDYVQKEKKAGMKYSIVSHDAVTALVRPVMVKHGVVYFPHDLEVKQDGNRSEAKFKVRFVNVDDKNDFIDVATFGYGIDDQDKGPGKAMSYGVKYAMLKALGLETGDDPDLEQDTKHVSAEAERRRLWVDGKIALMDAAGTVDELRNIHTEAGPKLADIRAKDVKQAALYDAALARNKARFGVGKAAAE